MYVIRRELHEGIRVEGPCDIIVKASDPSQTLLGVLASRRVGIQRIKITGRKMEVQNPKKLMPSDMLLGVETIVPSGPLNPEDGRKGIGRTTAYILLVISEALLDPGQWKQFIDHAPTFQTDEGIERFASILRNKVRQLGLRMEIMIMDKRLMIRSTPHVATNSTN